MEFAVFFVITRNRLSFLNTTLESLRAQHPGLRAYVLILDPPLGGSLELGENTLTLNVEQIGVTKREYVGLLAAHSPFEIACIMKTRLARFLLVAAAENVLFYCDTDLYFFHPLTSALETMKSAGILLTPHLLTRLLKPEREQVLHEAKINLAGIFNLGFFGMKKGDETRQFIDWWSHRTQLGCKRNLDQGLYDDQKWLDFGVHLFSEVRVHKDPGYNVANWNLSERRLSYRAGRYWVNETLPLVFFHFSRFEPHQNEKLSPFLDIKLNSHNCLSEICAQYSAQLMHHDWLRSHRLAFEPTFSQS